MSKPVYRGSAQTIEGAIHEALEAAKRGTGTLPTAWRMALLDGTCGETGLITYRIFVEVLS